MQLMHLVLSDQLLSGIVGTGITWMSVLHGAVALREHTCTEDCGHQGKERTLEACKRCLQLKVLLCIPAH